MANLFKGTDYILYDSKLVSKDLKTEIGTVWNITFVDEYLRII